MGRKHYVDEKLEQISAILKSDFLRAAILDRVTFHGCNYDFNQPLGKNSLTKEQNKLRYWLTTIAETLWRNTIQNGA